MAQGEPVEEVHVTLGDAALPPPSTYARVAAGKTKMQLVLPLQLFDSAVASAAYEGLTLSEWTRQAMSAHLSVEVP